MDTSRTYSGVFIAILVSVIIIVLFVVFVKPEPLTFADFTALDVANKFAPLLLIALIIERTLEVFLTIWRGPDSAKYDLDLKHQKAKGSKSDLVEIQSQEKKLLEYKQQTQRIAFASSVALGILISALGIRALEPFVDADSLFQLPDFQQSTFRLVDVLLTGTLLGGGADGLHKIIAAFTTFMDSSKDKAR